VIGLSLEFYANFVLSLRRVWIGLYFHSQLVARVIVIFGGSLPRWLLWLIFSVLGCTVFLFSFCSVLYY